MLASLATIFRLQSQSLYAGILNQRLVQCTEQHYAMLRALQSLYERLSTHPTRTHQAGGAYSLVALTAHRVDHRAYMYVRCMPYCMPSLHSVQAIPSKALITASAAAFIRALVAGAQLCNHAAHCSLMAAFFNV